MADETAAFLTDDTCLREAFAANDFSKLAATDIKIIETLPEGTQMYDVEQAITMLKEKEALDPYDEKALDSLVEHHQWRKINPEDLPQLADGAGKTFAAYYDEIDLELSEALAIRQWRCKNRFSWRLVAAMNAGLESGGDNQLEGMALCKRAAEMFEENYLEGDWN